MTDRPIIFSAPMVLALLAGWKTQTRRLARLKPIVWFHTEGKPPEPIEPASRWQKVQPGDRLWVREAFTIVPRTAYARSDGVQQVLSPDDSHDAAIFRAGWERSTGGLRWRPSIHMPRWASRLTLTVTEQRVQKLHEISETDAEAEGVAPFVWVGRTLDAPHRYNFQLLWNELHGPNAWNANPGVVALTFTVAQRNIDA